MLECAPNPGTNSHPARQGPNLNVNESLLPYLRRSTREAHTALEAQPLVRALLDPVISLAGYVQVLRAFATFYQPLERQLSAALDDWGTRAPSPYRYQPRLPLLRADLADLGVDSTPEAAAGSDLPVVVNAETALGVLYVLEGATQGGRVIAPRLRQSLEVSGSFGARYFTMYRQLDSWTLFREWMARIEPQLDRNATLNGARSTFTGLHAHLDHWQVSPRDR